jgi:transposase
LVVDMFTGYNVVTGTGKRDRAGCLAHVRRRFFDALPYAHVGRIALDFIRDVYVVEHDAIAAGVAGTEEHRRMRQARTGPIMARLMTWHEAMANGKDPLAYLTDILGRIGSHPATRETGAPCVRPPGD